METQRTANLLNDSDDESSKFLTRKWYVINYQSGRKYGEGSVIKFEKKVIKPSLCNYSDAYILLTGNIKVAAAAAGNNNAFKNCAVFTRCLTHINHEHIDTAENVDIIMPMYNFTECSDNYSDKSVSI